MEFYTARPQRPRRQPLTTRNVLLLGPLRSRCINHIRNLSVLLVESALVRGLYGLARTKQFYPSIVRAISGRILILAAKQATETNFSPQSRLRPISPFSYVGQGHRGHQDQLEQNFALTLCSSCLSVDLSPVINGRSAIP